MASDTREQILEAAVDIIAREGMAKATNRRIAERAGVPLGLITYHFTSKNDLLLSTTQRINDVLSVTFGGIPEGQGLGESLATLIAATWRWMQQDPDYQIAVIEMSIWHARQKTGTSPDAYRVTLDYLTTSALGTVPEAERERVREEVKTLVAMGLGTLDGLFLQQLTNAAGDYDGMVARAVDQVRRDGDLLLTRV